MIDEVDGAPAGASRPKRATDTGARPRLVEGAQLLGAMKGTGYAEASFLIRSPEGAYCRVSELLFHIAQDADGRRTLEEIATRVSLTAGKPVSADNVAWLIRQRLKGLVHLADEAPSASGGTSRTPLQAPRPIVRLRLRRVILGERLVAKAADVLEGLFSPVIVMAILALGAVMIQWLWTGERLHDALTIFADPRDVLTGLGLFLLGTVFHEFGHASALKRGGGRPGGLGVGLFIAWPAFFTEVTDAYRLSRWRRLRVDLGGVYFNLIFALALFALHWATGYPPLLLATVLVVLEAGHQLLPLVRLDGYYVVADLAGVPDPLRQMSAYLARRASGAERSAGDRLKLVPKIAVALYLLAALPLMFWLMGRILVRFPHVFTSIWKGELTAVSIIGEAVSRSDWFSVVAASIGALVLALIPIGIVLTTSSLFARMGRGLWRWSAGSEARRAFAFSAFAATCLALGAAWVPSENWEQIQRGLEQRASIDRRPAVLDVQMWDPAPAESWGRRRSPPPRRPVPSARR